MNYDVEMPPHVEDMARWLDDDKQVDPSNGERAYSVTPQPAANPGTLRFS
jgi:hypothetical protein